MAGRKRITPADPGTAVQIAEQTPAAVAAQEISWRQADAEAVARATEVAKELRYDEELSIGALEDGIRLYQRRAVEDFLELGKRLLLLRELAPHGEFTQRIAVLGFAPRAAQKFMQAAAKAAKSEKLALLAGKVKNPSVFVELIALDDDTLEEFGDMDDIESLTAPEAKRRIRDLQADIEAKDDRAAKRERDIENLQKKLRQAKLERQRAEPDDIAGELRTLASAAALQVRADIGATGDDVESLQERIAALCEHAASAGGDGDEHHPFMGALIGELFSELRRVRDAFGLPIVNDHGAPDWQQGL